MTSDFFEMTPSLGCRPEIFSFTVRVTFTTYVVSSVSSTD
jgi:hypothetical protein